MLWLYMLLKGPTVFVLHVIEVHRALVLYVIEGSYCICYTCY